jgi:site-specific recombinase XerD
MRTSYRQMRHSEFSPALSSSFVRRAARRAGITKPVGPHTLWHAFIAAALDAGVPLRDVQEAASHADPGPWSRMMPPVPGNPG